MIDYYVGSAAPTGRCLSAVVILILAATASSACSTATNRRDDGWPSVNALPHAPPDDLDADASSAVLRTGSDGFVYAVGMAEDAAPGRPFLASYSGKWPIENLDRPVMAMGRLVRTYDGGVGLVHLSYQLPDSDLDNLQVAWDGDLDDAHLGKGRARVASVAKKPSISLTLSIGKDQGVREGDFYAILTTPTADAAKQPDSAEPRSFQLSRRLTAVCMVKRAKDDSASCSRWRASKLHPRLSRPKKGQTAVFLEHTFGAKPRQGVIQIGHLQADRSGLQKRVAQSMRNYLQTVTAPHVGVSIIDETFDVSAPDFYRQSDTVKPLAKPQLIVGLTVDKRNGDDHLIATYTGVGPTSGPGMVAAPPRGGIDLGTVEDLNETRLQNFAATVWAGMLVYRGQTSEALLQLHQMLSDPTLAGPTRWHARDQYAMRWGALGRYREALWLVSQDEAVARDADNPKAWLNALGTRVRLYDFLGLPDHAVSTSRKFLDARQSAKPGHNWRGAVAMYGEMLMADGRVDDALATVNQLTEACPKGCHGDLHSLVAGIFWNVPDDRPEVQSQLMSLLVDHLEQDNLTQMAATRLYQGLMALRSESYNQALVAFREAERLYGKENNINGRGRAIYFQFMTQLSRGKPQQAFRLGQAAQKLEMKLNDFDGTAQIFQRMSVLYSNPEFLEQPGPYLGAARQVLSGAVDASIAQGDFGKAAENLLSLGGFMVKIGQHTRAKTSLNQAIAYGVTFNRFGVAALGHLYLGGLARQNGNVQAFKQEIKKARVLAEISDDPTIIEAIENALNPKKEDDVPTQLL